MRKSFSLLEKDKTHRRNTSQIILFIAVEVNKLFIRSFNGGRETLIPVFSRAGRLLHPVFFFIKLQDYFYDGHHYFWTHAFIYVSCENPLIRSHLKRVLRIQIFQIFSVNFGGGESFSERK